MREVTQTAPYAHNADDNAFAKAVRMEMERILARVRHQSPEKDVVVRVEFVPGTASPVCVLVNLRCSVTGILTNLVVT